jgi:hypothetical protein
MAHAGASLTHRQALHPSACQWSQPGNTQPRINMPKTTTFTPEQLKRFAEYVRIQRVGKFNMFDPRARRMTNQTTEEWVFNMEHYDALEAAAKEQQ